MPVGEGGGAAGFRRTIDRCRAHRGEHGEPARLAGSLAHDEARVDEAAEWLERVAPDDRSRRR